MGGLIRPQKRRRQDGERYSLIICSTRVAGQVDTWLGL